MNGDVSRALEMHEKKRGTTMKMETTKKRETTMKMETTKKRETTMKMETIRTESIVSGSGPGPGHHASARWRQVRLLRLQPSEVEDVQKGL
jgi:hypothetical protein